MTLHRRLAALSGLAVVLVPVAAACSLPADDRVTTYNPAELPAPLTETTTTSTSTTTTTVVPDSTLPAPDGESSTTAPTTTVTTTIPLIETEIAEIFYTVGVSDDLQRLRQNLPAPVTVQQLIAQLETPPQEVSEFNLRTALRTGLVDEVTLDRATATVSLSEEVLRLMPDSQERRAIAQIVLTLTSFVTPDSGAIGLVSFEVDGDPISVFIPFQGSADPGEAVAFVDYAPLIVDRPIADPTTTTTTTTVVPEPGPRPTTN